MSGGHYNHAYHHVAEFSEALEVEPKNGDYIDPYVNYDLRKRFKEHLIKVAQAMRAIEWNDSHDGAPKESELIVDCLRGPDL